MSVRDLYVTDPAPASTLMIVSGFSRPEFLVEARGDGGRSMSANSQGLRSDSSDVTAQIHAQLTKAGIPACRLAPRRRIAPLIERIAADNQIRHVRVAREAEAIAVCSGAFFGGVRAVALMGATGLLTCTGELATLNLRHQIPVFLMVSQRARSTTTASIRDSGRRTIPLLLETYDFPYHIIDRAEDILQIPDAFETCRLQKRPFVLFLTRRLVKGDGASA
jgi:sulfopyruvate decarboxylase subunit alpha